MAQSGSGAAVLLLVIVGIIAFGGFWAVDATVDDVSNETAVETTVNQTTDDQRLSDIESHLDADRFVGPTAENQTRTLERGEDYSFDESDGLIRFDEASENETTGDPETVNLTATAVGLPEDGGAALDMVEPVMQVPIWMILVVGAGTVLVGLQMLNQLQSRRRRAP